jgi:hypothetical protein
MASVQMDGVLDQLTTELRRAMEDTLKHFELDEDVTSSTVSRYFLRLC